MIFAGVTAIATAAGGARTQVSLESMPGGLFGYVTSPRTSCAQG
jgi:hypothetical protein